MTATKLIVALGGTMRTGSSTEAAIRRVAHHAAALGAETRVFAGEALDLPIYLPGADVHDARVEALVEAIRAADAIILASPAYHGGVSGLVKNAIDYVEALARDARPYLTGRTVGCIAAGAGWQGANAALQGLRSIAHALRGWPTPLGIAFNTKTPAFAADGACLLPELDAQFAIMANELAAPR